MEAQGVMMTDLDVLKQFYLDTVFEVGSISADAKKLGINENNLAIFLSESILETPVQLGLDLQNFLTNEAQPSIIYT